MTVSWRGERVLQLAKIVLPGDIRQRCRLPHVADLARDIRSGLASELAVARKSKGKWRLVTGEDLAAAHILLQYPEIRVREVLATDGEAKLLQLAEQKRGVTDERKLAALHKQIDALLEEAARNPPAPPAAQRGRRRSALSQAAGDVAKLTGLDPRSLMRSYRRKEQASPDPDFVLPAEPTILDLGMPLSAGFLAHVADIQAATTAALDGLERARRAMHKLEALPYPKHAIALADIEELQERLRKFWPFSLCAFCKGIAGVQEGCTACSIQGWLGKGQLEGIPDKLWDKVDRVVMVAGTATRVADLLPSTELE